MSYDVAEARKYIGRMSGDKLTKRYVREFASDMIKAGHDAESINYTVEAVDKGMVTNFEAVWEIVNIVLREEGRA